MTKLTLKEIQSGSLETLEKLEEICDKIGARYFLTFGSLLGAIRHKGFIPWDDDIDIFMPRPDYEKFVNYCKESAESILPFELKHFSTCKKYVYPIARMSDSRYYVDYNTDKDYGLGLFVDIYPLDGFNPEDKKTQKKILNLRKIVGYCALKRFVKSGGFVKNVFRFVAYSLSRFINLNKILKKMDNLAKKNAYEDFEKVSCTLWEAPFYIEKSEFDKITDVPFENTTARIPNGYHDFLTRTFGDYMTPPPENDQTAHHFYSAYKK